MKCKNNHVHDLTMVVRLRMVAPPLQYNRSNLSLTQINAYNDTWCYNEYSGTIDNTKYKFKPVLSADAPLANPLGR